MLGPLFVMKDRGMFLPSMLAFLAFTLWSVGDFFIKLASESGSTPFWAMAFMGLGNVVCLSVWALFRRNVRLLWPQKPLWVWLRAVLSVIAAFCFFTAYTNLSLSEAYVVEFLAPFCICVGAAFLMKEAFPLQKQMIVVIGFAGCLMAVLPGLKDALSVEGGEKRVWGYMAAFAGTVFFSAVQLLSRHSIKSETSESILFAASLLIGTVGLMATGLSFDILQSKAIVCLAVLPFTNMAGALLMLAAHKYGEAANVSVFHYWQLVMGAFFGLVVWGEIPSLYLVAGSVIVVLSGLYMMHLDRREKRALALAR